MTNDTRFIILLVALFLLSLPLMIVANDPPPRGIRIASVDAIIERP
jgi:hypothetical protein